MRKIFALILSVICLLSLTACGGQGKPADATDALANPDAKPRETRASITESTEQTELTEQTEPTEYKYDDFIRAVIEAGSYVGHLESLRYFAFVYSEDDTFAFAREEVIGPNDCKEGYLYVKDHFEDVIWQVIEEPVREIQMQDDMIFAALENNTIIQVDYFGENRELLYEGEKAAGRLIILDNLLYFMEDEDITAFDLETHEAAVVCHCPGITDYYFYDWYSRYDDENIFLFWTDQDGYLYGFNKETGESTMLEPESGK